MSLLTKLCSRFCKPKQTDPLVSRIDTRDFISGLPTQGLPAKVDMRPDAGKIIEDQLHTNSCAAQALTSMAELMLARQGIDQNLSALALYYWARVESWGRVYNDTGVYLRDAFKAANKYGISLESDWPFDTSKLYWQPPEAIKEDALKRRVTRYESCGAKTDESILQIKANLCLGRPVVIGATVGASLSSLRTFVGYRGVNGDSIGGHAMLVVGYDDSIQSLIIENSYNRSFGENGFFAMPYGVFKRDSYESWTCDFSFVQPVVNFQLPVKRVPKMFLNGSEKTVVASPYMLVYGTNDYDSVVIKDGAFEVVIDANVDDIYFEKLANPLARQFGSAVEIWENSTKIATISASNKTCNLYFADYGRPYEFWTGYLDGRVQMKIGNRFVSNVSPEAV